MGRLIAAVLCAALLIDTTAASASAQPVKTEMQKAVGHCMLSVAGGAIFGALLGAAVQRRGGAVKGGLAGGLVGAGFCGVMMKMASDRDKAKVAEAEQLAAANDQAQDIQYVGDDGQARRIQVSVREAPSLPTAATLGAAASAEPPTPCHYVDATLTVQGAGQAQVPSQLVCRTASGEWLPHAPPGAATT